MNTEKQSSKPEDSPQQEAGEGCSGAPCYAVRVPNRDKLSRPPEGSAVFEVVGAGFLAFGGDAECFCGNARGCSVDNSWTEWGYSGGVMDMKEMERLRDHLTAILEHNKEDTE